MRSYPTSVEQPFFVTVFAPKGEHGHVLMEMEEKGLPITVVGRVLVRDYDEKSGWKGFFVFEDRPHPWPYALVVEEVLTTELPTGATGGRKSARETSHAESATCSRRMG